MNRSFRIATLGLCVFSLSLTESSAFLDILKKSKDKKVANAEELTTQESAAATQLAKANSQRDAGRKRQARDSYKSIVNNFPRTDAAAEAQFQFAKILQQDGEGQKAFDAFEELITNFRNTANFNAAVKAQFDIAESLKNSKKKGFMGIGAAAQPSDLIEMFEKISEVAPYTEYAPRSLLNVGYVQTEIGDENLAILAFRNVVDNYQGTQYATEAQYQIFQLRGVKAEESNSPVEDRAQVEAGIDFMNQNPNDQRAQEIQQDLQEIQLREMEKQYNIGMHYEKAGKPDSARIYYREVVKNPGTPWASKAQERLNALDRAPAADSVEKRAGFFGPNPLKKDKVEMRTSDDAVLPLPASES
ncbi:MAG: tetratricopeptide repeat protein [Verrucomicrobiota bacterium]